MTLSEAKNRKWTAIRILSGGFTRIKGDNYKLQVPLLKVIRRIHGEGLHWCLRTVLGRQAVSSRSMILPLTVTAAIVSCFGFSWDKEAFKSCLRKSWMISMVYKWSGLVLKRLQNFSCVRSRILLSPYVCLILKTAKNISPSDWSEAKIWQFFVVAIIKHLQLSTCKLMMTGGIPWRMRFEF